MREVSDHSESGVRHALWVFEHAYVSAPAAGVLMHNAMIFDAGMLVHVHASARSLSQYTYGWASCQPLLLTLSASSGFGFQ